MRKFKYKLSFVVGKEKTQQGIFITKKTAKLEKKLIKKKYPFNMIIEKVKR